MNSFSNFLWKIFSVTMVFFCHIGVGYAEEESPNLCQGKPCIDSDDPKIVSGLFANSTSAGTQRQICASGKYVARCGSYTIGTNWLFGMSKRSNANVVASPNYYSYNSGSDTTNMDNLRKFFNGKETMVYNAQSSDGGTITTKQESVQPSDYILYRNIILSNFCTDDEGQLNTQCETCPNKADIPASTVETSSTYDSGMLVWTSWNVHTIADCYMREFSDETGEYVYTANNTSNNTGINCYYTTKVPGSSLPRPGITDTTTDTTNNTTDDSD